jgi:hypothetical protein
MKRGAREVIAPLRWLPAVLASASFAIAAGIPALASAQEDAVASPQRAPVVTPPPPLEPAERDGELGGPAGPSERERELDDAHEPFADRASWQPPLRPSSDRLMPTGVVFAVLGAVAIAIGATLRITGDCAARGETGCSGVGATWAGVGLIAGGATAGTIGVVALALGLDDPVPEGMYRRSERRMVTGVALTAIGASAAVGGGVVMLVDRLGPAPSPGRLVPSAVMVGVGSTLAFIGLPLWGDGASTVSTEDLWHQHRREREDDDPRETKEPRRVGPGMRNAGLGLVLGGAVVGAAGLVMLESKGSMGAPIAGLGGLALLTGIPLLAVGQVRNGTMVGSTDGPTLQVGPTSASVRGSF